MLWALWCLLSRLLWFWCQSTLLSVLIFLLYMLLMSGTHSPTTNLIIICPFLLDWAERGRTSLWNILRSQSKSRKHDHIIRKSSLRHLMMDQSMCRSVSHDQLVSTWRWTADIIDWSECVSYKAAEMFNTIVNWKHQNHGSVLLGLTQTSWLWLQFTSHSIRSSRFKNLPRVTFQSPLIPRFLGLITFCILNFYK